MEKIINPFGKKTRGGRGYNVYFQITTKDSHPCKYFAISGVEGPLASGNALGGCGQIIMHLKNEDRSTWNYRKGFNDEIMDKLFAIWDAYHLSRKDIPQDVIDFIDSLAEPAVSPAWV